MHDPHDGPMATQVTTVLAGEPPPLIGNTLSFWDSLVPLVQPAAHRFTWVWESM